MPAGYLPTIFVSSTCYDLKQLRVDLKEFIEKLGCEPVLSEFASFPVNPNVGAVESCLEAVRKRADIFVLIVGGRYGSSTETGKSVTNLEYLEARTKGIPIYVFVGDNIMPLLPVWKQNPDGNFNGIVDSPKLFEFIESLKEAHEKWVFQFQHAQGIIDTLRTQFAYLFMEALQFRTQFLSTALPESLSNLSGPSLKLVIERPRAWPGFLLCQVWDEELQAAKSLRRDLEYGLNTEKVVRLRGQTPQEEFNNLSEWLTDKMADFLQIRDTFIRLVNVIFNPTTIGYDDYAKAELIVYVARGVGKIYRRLIEWAMDCRSLSVDKRVQRIPALASKCSAPLLQDMEEFAEKIRNAIEQAWMKVESGEPVDDRVFKFELTQPEIVKELAAELERIRKL